MNDMDLEYMVAEAGTVEAMTALVNELLADGWVPQGGICGGPHAYLQSMLRASEPDAETSLAASAVQPAARRSHRSATSKL